MFSVPRFRSMGSGPGIQIGGTDTLGPLIGSVSGVALFAITVRTIAARDSSVRSAVAATASQVVRVVQRGASP
jgi:hypothetical protein